MCQSVNSNWIRSFLFIVLIEVKVTLGNETSTQSNDSLLTVHPWLPIGNFTGIILNDNSVNQSYYSYNYNDNVSTTYSENTKLKQSDDKMSDGEMNVDNIALGEPDIATLYSRIGNNYSESDKVNPNPDESSLSFLDDSPTKEEDYAGGNYGSEDDILGSEGGNGNFASQEDDEGLT